LPYAISTTRDGITYTISADEFGFFVNDVSEVGGLDGFIAKVAELPNVMAVIATVSDTFGDVNASDEMPQPDQCDPLADLIRDAPDVKTLTALWRANKAAWNGDYNKLADKRKQEL